jgi:hypothetical protein
MNSHRNRKLRLVRAYGTRTPIAGVQRDHGWALELGIHD